MRYRRHTQYVVPLIIEVSNIKMPVNDSYLSRGSTMYRVELLRSTDTIHEGRHIVFSAAYTYSPLLTINPPFPLRMLVCFSRSQHLHLLPESATESWYSIIFY